MDSDQADPILVYDVGGTSLRAGRYDVVRGRVDGIVRRSTPSRHTLPGASPTRIRKRLVRALVEMADEVSTPGGPREIAISFPGPVTPEGRVLAAPTVWGDDPSGPFDIASPFRDRWPEARVTTLNDVTAAGYRYLGDAHADLCVVTVSSGIGHKVFIDGRPVVGPAGRGGEIGHWRVDPRPAAPPCDCGGRGHLGALASGRATRYHVGRLAKQSMAAFGESWLGQRLEGRPEALDNRVFAEGFREGDGFCEAVVQSMAAPLGLALSAIHLGVGVERFVIFGGFARALGPRYLDLLAAAASECGWEQGASWSAMLEAGADDDDSGLIGAGECVRRAGRP